MHAENTRKSWNRDRTSQSQSQWRHQEAPHGKLHKLIQNCPTLKQFGNPLISLLLNSLAHRNVWKSRLYIALQEYKEKNIAEAKEQANDTLWVLVAFG